MKKLCALLTSTVVLFSLFSMTAFALGEDSVNVDMSSIASQDLVGDINLDDKVDVEDWKILVKELIDIQNDYENLPKDVNEDSSINIKDLVRMKKIIANVQ